MELVIISGLSGAGKSHALHCLEDIGYYCVDNMPTQLVGAFIKLVEDEHRGLEKVAFAVDVRGAAFIDEGFEDTLSDLDKENLRYRIIYLDASNAALIRRFKETRRLHPLTGDDLAAGIEKERALLEPLRQRADIVIDTSGLKTSELNAEIKRILDAGHMDNFSITITSFGFKNGIPPEADWVLDVRFLPNPFYVASLKKLTGNNKKVAEYVFSDPKAGKFAGRVTGLVLDLIPGYIKEGKYQINIAVGCTGGQHRSVAVANELARRFGECGRFAQVKHREL